MLRLLIDENVDYRLVRGLKFRLPQLDLVLVRQVGLGGFADPVLLDWAAENDRTIVTHDVQTMIYYANQLLQNVQPMAGLIVVPQRMGIGRAIRDLELLIPSHSQPEFRDRIEYLPRRDSPFS